MRFFSCTGAVLTQLEAADRAQFVGEAAAGNRRVFCGVGRSEYLPNSKISLSVPRVQFHIVDSANNRDVVLEKALSLF